MHDSNLKSRWDYENSIAFAEEEAEHKKALHIATKLKKEGSSIEFIAKITELSIEEIAKL
jgi:hypothetical protein